MRPTRACGIGPSTTPQDRRASGLQLRNGLRGTNGSVPKLAADIAMHIAWANPQYVSKEDVPAEDLNREIEVEKGRKHLKVNPPPSSTKS